MADHTPKKALALLDQRDERRCILTDYRGDRIVPQHRQGGMGGSKFKHRTANLLHIDSITNGLLEADADLKRRAKVYGVSIPSWAYPEKVPVFYPHEHAWSRLEGDGRTQITTGEAHALMHATYGPDWFVLLAQVEGAEPRSLARLRGWF